MIIDIQCEETVGVEVFGVDSNHVQDEFVVLDFQCPYCGKQYRRGEKVVYAEYRHFLNDEQSGQQRRAEQGAG